MIIYILWLRQMKRYFRSRSRIIGSLAQPLLFLFALGYGLGPVFQKAGQGSYLQFLVPGIIAQSILFTAMFSGIEIIWDRRFGFLKEMLVAPISRLEIMVGRTLGGTTVAIFQGLVVLLISFLAGFKVANIFSFLTALIFMFLIAILFAGLGTAIASVLEDMQGFQLIMNFLIMPLLFLSGTFFPVKGLSGALSVIVKIDPLSYGVDGLRGALSGVYGFGFWPDFLVLALIASILTVIGSYLFFKVQI